MAMHVIRTAPPYGRYGYHPYFTEKAIRGTERVSDLPDVTQHGAELGFQPLITILSYIIPQDICTVLITTAKEML